MKTPILRCQNASKTFEVRQKKLEVLKNIEFIVHSGETVLIFGKSGQGKSVLLSLLAGLDHPTSGDIYFDGVWYSSCTIKQMETIRRTQVGIIFQNLNLMPSWTALENVEAALDDHILSPHQKRNRAQTLLEEIGLSARMNHIPGELSMGEQQRVAIARTLIREPKLILADEPTGDLDMATADQLLKLLYSYLQKTGATLLLATHGNFPDMHFERTFILNQGNLSQLNQQDMEASWKLKKPANNLSPN